MRSKLAIAVLLILAGTTLGMEAAKSKPEAKKPPKTEQAVVIPRLLDLGADRCIPCKMMQPILEELRKEYRGKLQVDFIDVWKNQAEAERYHVRAIPTQIFYDKGGKEVFRHEGFYSKEAILAKLSELGLK
ncbi:MAG TPA: thioredoxin [Cyanobacteria bacterium UBA8530]|nr:thioredoxin [Cyanobacteria bacterium UBA8530]